MADLMSRQTRTSTCSCEICVLAAVSYETIQLEMRGTVGVIALDRPESLNVLPLAMGREFQAAVAEACGAFIEKRPPKFVGG